MMSATLAHVSDLHIGRNAETDRRAEALCQALLARRVDHLAVTGDITHRGRREELGRFFDIFAPFVRGGRLSLVPGNHDRLGDEVAARLMGPPRVEISVAPGLHLVRFDSTGPHNRSRLASHGLLSRQDIDDIVAALDRAPAGTLSVLLLHHHLLPFPHDSAAEWLSAMLGRQWAAELPQGRALVSRLAGRCDLVLHGHRHHPGTTSVFTDSARPLALFNAGASGDLGHVRLFSHARGSLCAPPTWHAIEHAGPSVWPVREHVVPVALPLG